MANSDIILNEDHVIVKGKLKVSSISNTSPQLGSIEIDGSLRLINGRGISIMKNNVKTLSINDNGSLNTKSSVVAVAIRCTSIHSSEITSDIYKGNQINLGRRDNGEVRAGT